MPDKAAVGRDSQRVRKMTAIQTKIIETRDHQRELADDAVAILARSDHAYVEAPPAAGKTLVLALIANELPYGRAFYLAHTVDLVDQARREVALYRAQGLVRDDISWRFLTRAAYGRLVKKDALGDGEHAAFVDECHMGGVSRSGPAKKQFPAVIATSAKVVWISATPWQLDEGMMGPREDNTSALSYEDAFEKGLLNDTDLIRVDCGLDIKVRLDPGVRDWRQLHRREGDEYVVMSGSAEDQHRALDGIVREALHRGIRTTDVPALVRYRWELMVRLYRQLHDGERAIFWLPSKQHARDCAAHLNALAGRDDFAEAVLGEHPGTAEAEADRKAITDWMDPNGRMKVVCVVYRLREGFDYPELAHGFDCSWNPYNYRNSVQKIGRLTRKAPGKPRGRYYYAVDAVTVAGARSRRFSTHFLESLGRAFNEADLAMSADAFEEARSMVSALGMDVRRHEAVPEIDNVDLGDRHLRIATTPMFHIINARKVALTRPLSFEELLEEASMSALEKLVRDIERGRKPMPPISQRGEGSMIRRAVTPSSKTYRPDIRQRLVACGAYRPKGYALHDAKQRIDATVAAIEAGEQEMSPGGDAYRFLYKYFNPKNETFRPDVRRRLLACGALAGRGRGPLGSIERPDVFAEAMRLEAESPEEDAGHIAGRIGNDGGLSRHTLRSYVRKARQDRSKPASADRREAWRSDMRIVVIARTDEFVSRFEEVVGVIAIVLDMDPVLNVSGITACLAKHLSCHDLHHAVAEVLRTVMAAALKVGIQDDGSYHIESFRVAEAEVTVTCDPQEDSQLPRDNEDGIDTL